MKLPSLCLIAAGVIFPAIAFLKRPRANRTQRIGMVIGIRPDQITAYEALHAASNAGVRDLLAKYHMHNFSILPRQARRRPLLLIWILRVHGPLLYGRYGKTSRRAPQSRMAGSDGSHADPAARQTLLVRDA